MYAPILRTTQDTYSYIFCDHKTKLRHTLLHSWFNSRNAKVESGGIRLSSGRVTENRPPRIYPALPNLLANAWRTGNAAEEWKDAPVLKKSITLIAQQLPRDSACCPFRQSFAENGRIPPQQLLRGRRILPNEHFGFRPARSTVDIHAVRRATDIFRTN